MSTHTHTKEGGTGENMSKLRIMTQNMGGFGLEVRSHKNRTKAGPKMQYLRKSCNILEKARTGIPQMYMY